MRSFIATGVAAMILATTSATSAEDSSASLRISNSDLLSSADVAESAGLQPISIVGVRNGWFSGKVVARSFRTIEDLKVADQRSQERDRDDSRRPGANSLWRAVERHGLPVRSAWDRHSAGIATDGPFNDLSLGDREGTEGVQAWYLQGKSDRSSRCAARRSKSPSR